MNGDPHIWVAAWLRDGDEAAARQLMENYRPLVAALVRRHLHDPNAVEDILQGTFVRFFTHAGRLDPTMPYEPWLARVAINLCRDHYRSLRRRPEVAWEEISAAEQSAFLATLPGSAAQDSAFANESRTLLLRLLDTLPADDRMVLSLLHLEEKTTEQIAALTGWSRVMVKVRAFRARKKLRTAFEKLEAKAASSHASN